LKFTFKRILIGAFLALMLLIGLFVSIFWTSDVKTTLHTAQIDWLPSSATDVSQQIQTGFGANELIECTLPEKDFLALAERRKWQIKAKERFWASKRIIGFPKLRDIPPVGPVDIALRGYEYESRGSNAGGISVWYDSDLQRMGYATSDH
jgi:hypothetical protein